MLIEIRDALKPVTQASWSIRSLPKHLTDLEKLDPSQYDTVFNLYMSFFDDIEHSRNRLKKVIERYKTSKTNKQINNGSGKATVHRD